MKVRPTISIGLTVAFIGALVLGTAPGMAAARPLTSHWSIRPSPNPKGSAGSFLSAVACAADGTCTAVGDYSPGSGLVPLAERWDGTSWTIEPMPAPAGESLVTGVACPGPQLCVAVGYSVTTKVRALVELWNGTSWTIVPAPRPSRAFWYELQGVSCTGTTDCTAVGGSIGRGVDAVERPLAERWNGETWSIERMPNPHEENGSSLTGVACVDASTCEAAGDYVFADVEEAVFAFGWNGTRWAQQDQPNPGGSDLNTSGAVSCSIATSCASVGSWTDFDGRIRALAEHWDGAAWTQQHARDPMGSAVSELFGVSCPSSTACSAVGEWSKNANGSPELTLAEVWDGSAWTIQGTPNPHGATDSALNGAVCPSPGTCFAVGSAIVDGVSQTLVEAYSA